MASSNIFSGFTSFKGSLLQLIGYLETIRSIQTALADGARIEN